MDHFLPLPPILPNSRLTRRANGDIARGVASEPALKHSNAYGGLVLQSNVLYGFTAGGGDFGWGVAFSVNTDGSGFTTLYSVGLFDLLLRRQGHPKLKEEPDELRRTKLKLIELAPHSWAADLARISGDALSCF